MILFFFLKKHLTCIKHMCSEVMQGRQCHSKISNSQGGMHGDILLGAS